MRLKIHYQSLTELYDEDQSLYDLYTLIKSQCHGLTHKPGFLTCEEIKTLATTYYNNKKSTVYSRLNKLSKRGYFHKTKYGYYLTSTSTVNNNIHNFKLSTNSRGRNYHPYASIEVPNTSETSIVRLVRMYLLLKQIHNRKKLSKGLNLKAGKNSGKKTYVPERLEIALDYLRKAGKYSSKTVVSNTLQELERIGLIKIIKTGFNYDMGSYNTNIYEIFNPDRANWKVLNEASIKLSAEKYMESLGNVLPRITKKKRVSTATKRKPVVRTEIQKRFIEFVQKVLFKKIRITSISKTLNYILSNESLKDIFLKEFSSSNVQVISELKTIYDPQATSHYRSVYDYLIDKVELVESGGNYDGRLLTSYDEALKNAYYKVDNYLFDEFPVVDDETGEYLIEDVDDYYNKVLPELKIEKLGYAKYNLRWLSSSII